MDFKGLIKNKNLYYVLFLIFFYLTFNYLQSYNLKSIPSCLYGCDYYYENGIALDYSKNPTHFWQSSTQDWDDNLNSLPKMSFVIEYIVSLFTNYSDLNFWKNIIIMSYILIIIGVIGWYIFYNLLFNNEEISFILTFLTISVTNFPFFKYSHSSIVFLPIFLYFLLKVLSYKKINKKYFIYLFLFLFVTIIYSNYHSMIFFITYFFIFFAFIIFKLFPFKINNIKKKIFDKKNYLFIGISFLSLFISLLLGWWYRVIFIYHGTENPFKFDVHISYLNLDNYFYYIYYYSKNTFFNFNDIVSFIIYIFFIGGFILFILSRKSLIKKNKFLFNSILLIIIVYFFSIFHYLVTIPLFGKQLSPNHAFSFLYLLFRNIFIGYLLYFLINFKSFKFKRHLFIIIFLGLFVMNFFLIVNNYENKINGKFWKGGYHEIPNYYKDLENYLMYKKINPSNMIVLSTNELSFALHGLYGVKTLVGRQSHFFIFGDFQKLWQDAALIYYSNSSKSRYILLKKYNKIAKEKGKKLYLYWDYYWINSEWQMNGKQYYPFDPLRFEDSLERENILKENGIKYSLVKNGIFEPSAQNNPHATRMDILYISPENYYNYTHPWNPDLNKYLEEVWSYEMNGQKIAKLYKINID